MPRMSSATPQLPGRESRQHQQQRRGAGAMLVAGAVLGTLATTSGLLAWVPAPSEKVPVPSRRGLLSAGASGLLAAGAGAAAPEAALAETAWQLKLPRAWKVFQTTDQPPKGVMKPVALVVAGNNDVGSMMVVLRVPLDTTDKSPDKAGSTALINYFTPPNQKPGAPLQQAVEAMTKSQKKTRGLTKFEIAGQPVDLVRGDHRYIRYDFDDSICPATQEQGVNGNRCIDQEQNPFPEVARRHAYTYTVDEDVLWVADISAPQANWTAVKTEIDTLSSSFVVGNGEVLEAQRIKEQTADVARLNKAAEEMMQQQEAEKAKK